MTLSPTPGQRGDALAGLELLAQLHQPENQIQLIMDPGHGVDATRPLAMDPESDPVAPFAKHRRNPWFENEQLHPPRNEIERLFRRPKALRGSLSRLDRPDVILAAFVQFPIIAEARRPETARTRHSMATLEATRGQPPHPLLKSR